jgi:uncharacterized repeat protein (TIGR01451 family)
MMLFTYSKFKDVYQILAVWYPPYSRMEVSMKKDFTVLTVLMAVLFLLVGSASAWGTSANVATIDDYSSSNTGTFSEYMGGYYVADYPAQTFTSLDLTGISAATLSGKDTLILWGYDPSLMTQTQKDDLNAWIDNGGKLIIWDSEDAAESGAGGTFDYSWMDFAFSVSGPGALGATGWPLWIVEENQLSTFAAGPFQIDNVSLSQTTDAVGDASVFTAENPSEWCVDMEAENALEDTGPVHVYSKGLGNGIVIYSGLDWDDAYYDYSSVGGQQLRKMLTNELNAASLPCSVINPGNLKVTKDADKSSYLPGEMITFTVTVENDGGLTVYDVVLTDTPPAEITLIDPASYNLGDIAAGGTSGPIIITATAVTPGTGLVNLATAAGDNAAGQPTYSGSDTAIFDIGTGPVNAPEFPTLALPIGMIIGIVFIVYSVKRKE